MDENTLSFRVAEALPKDVGRGLVRLDPQDLERLGVSIGDVVEITGKRPTVARAMPAYAEQRGQGLIQMDGILRANASASLDERVTARGMAVQPARSLVLAPVEGMRGAPGAAQTRYLARLLDGIPVVPGDRVRVNLFGTRAQNFTVVETTPAGPVLIGPSTTIRLASEGAGRERGTITYEDIGGLRREIRRIREMIELPLRYPEVFERLGIDPPKGVLLHGPPGTGKTLIARAVAHETSAHFLHVNGPEIMCVGGNTTIFTTLHGLVEAEDLFNSARGEIVRDDQIKIIELEKPIGTYAFSENRVQGAAITHVVKLTAPAYKVTLGDGNEIVCSHNQPFLIRENGNYTWKPLKELCGGMFVARVNGLPLPDATVKLESPELIERAGRLAPISRNGSRGHGIKLPNETSATGEQRMRLEETERSNREHSCVPTAPLLEALERGLFTEHTLTESDDVVPLDGALTQTAEVECMQLMRDDIAWEQVVDITPLGVQALYDFTVDKDSFVAAPYFLLHNSKYYGEAEGNLRGVFDEAKKRAPAIIFIDELDAIAPKREEMSGEKQVERRVVAQLLALMDGLESRGNIIVIAATNIPNTLDPALRRPGRFDREITIGVPDREGRREILEVHTRGMPLAEDVDLDRLAGVTHGFVGADLEALSREAAMSALRSLMPDIDFAQAQIPYEKLMALDVTMDDFLEAMGEVEPSAIREVFTEVPDVGWDDVGGLEEVKRMLVEAAEWPLRHGPLFERAGIRPSKGILLYGPPGTGKTLLAKALARESEANFISVKGPQLLSMWIGESERGVREVFRKARQAAPCIVFFDEIDAVAPQRGGGGDNQVTERVVSQLLTELDGIEDLKGVVVLAATNRMDRVDPALLRPGRFDFLVELPAPDRDARLAILRVHTRRMPLADDVDLEALATASEGFVGADLEGLCRRAALLAIREFLGHAPLEEAEAALNVCRRHFETAFEETYR